MPKGHLWIYQYFAEKRTPLVLCRCNALQSFTVQERSSQGLYLFLSSEKLPQQKFLLQVEASCLFKHDRNENLEKHLHIVVSVLLHNY